MYKILFTSIGNFSFCNKPTAISILTSILKKNGHEVLLFDPTFMDLGYPLDNELNAKMFALKEVDWNEYSIAKQKKINAKEYFIKLIQREKPDLIASSATSNMFGHTVEFMQKAKSKFNIPTLLGGIHATLQTDDAIQSNCFDYICVGEGENVILDIIDTILNKQNKISPLCKENNTKIFDGTLAELNSLPFMDYSVYDKLQFLRPFNGKIFRSGEIQSIRGCPKLCPYCANAKLNIIEKNRVRYLTPKRFVDEAEYLKKTYKLNFFKIFDEDILNRNENELHELSELYRKKVNLPFTSSTHPNSITKEKAKLLKNMNCVNISVSLECGNEHYRKYMLKRYYSNNDIIKSCIILKESGIRIALNSMIGLPYESRKMIFETVDINRKINPEHPSCNIFFPFLNTPLGDLCVKEKFVSAEKIKNTKFYDPGKSLLNMPQIDKSELEGIMRLWRAYMVFPVWSFAILKNFEKVSKNNEKILIVLITIEKFWKIIVKMKKISIQMLKNNTEICKRIANLKK